MLIVSESISCRVGMDRVPAAAYMPRVRAYILKYTESGDEIVYWQKSLRNTDSLSLPPAVAGAARPSQP